MGKRKPSKTYTAPDIDTLAHRHLYRKQRTYQGHYAAMRNIYGADAADQAILRRIPVLEALGETVVYITIFPAHFDRHVRGWMVKQ